LNRYRTSVLLKKKSSGIAENPKKRRGKGDGKTWGVEAGKSQKFYSCEKMTAHPT